MVLLKTYYLRVSFKQVILVEIHGVEPNGQYNWLQDRHLQEIIQLLHPAVTGYINTDRVKKQSTSVKQQQQKPSDIVTGTTVRFGYSFKTRLGRQTCLFEDYTTTTDLSSFYVFKEKVVVYAHPVVGGSPTGMSQLMKALKRKSVGQGVSISSYFQKLPSQTGSQSQSGSQRGTYDTQESQSTDSIQSCDTQSRGEIQSRSETQSTDSQTVEVVESCETATDIGPKCPPSEGRRHKIKNILKRGDIGLTRRQKRNRTTTDYGDNSDAEISHDVDKDVKTVDIDPVNFSASDDECSDVEGNNNTHGDGVSDTVDDFSVKSCDSPVLHNSSPSDSFMIGDIKVDRVDNPGISFTGVGDGHTVTVMSVEQVMYIQKLSGGDRDHQFMSPSPNSVISNQSYQSKAGSQSSSPIGNQSEPQSDTSDDVLPSASFCIQPSNKRSNSLNAKKMREFIKSKSNTSENTENQSSDIENTSPVEGKVTKGKHEADSSNTIRGSGLSKSRAKRKFPNFSDSDSDGTIPGKKQRTKPDAEKKFVNLDKMNSNTKKLNISKTFMTGDGGLAQPSLSYFINKKTDTRQEGSPVLDSKIKGADTGIDVIEGDTLDNEPEMPKIKNEADLSIKEEINSITSLDELNEQHLDYLVRKNEAYLRQIFEGKSPCQRHEDYKCGGNKKRALNHQCFQIRHYSEEQVNVVMQGLIAMFCKRHNKYLDYVMKVMLPEILTKIHMVINGTSHDESEREMAPSPIGPLTETP